MFQNIFKTDKKRSHLRNLVALAKLDGKITEEEYFLLLKIARKVGVSDHILNKMIKRTQKINVVKPDTIEIAFDYLYDFASMIVSNKFDEKEVDLAIKIAKELGFDSVKSEILVMKTCLMIQNSDNKEDIWVSLKNNLLV